MYEIGGKNRGKLEIKKRKQIYKKNETRRQEQKQKGEKVVQKIQEGRK